jgi:hypothetical protein
MIRSRLTAMVLGSLLLVVAPTTAVASGPQHERLMPYSVQIPAGDVCDFALDLAVTDAHATTITFPVDRNGDQRMQMVGQETVTATNVDDGLSRTIQEGVRIAVVTRADGTHDVAVSGISMSWYFASDAPGRGLWMNVGRIAYTADADWVAGSLDVQGRVEDLCAALSPA